MNRIKYMTKGLSILLASLTLCSCMDQINETMLSRANDEVAPVISEVTPEDGYAYGAYTQISGTVLDKDSDGGTGELDSLTLEIVGISEAIPLTVDDDGHFRSELLETTGSAYFGAINIRLTAVDWKGNSTEYDLNYSKADGEITNFTVERGNGELTLSWDGIPDGSSHDYEIRELFYGLGSATVSSSSSRVSHTWTGLTNGRNYSFVVSTASSSEGDDFTSSIRGSIPLSPLSCTPVVQLNNDSIELTWPELDDADKYVVQKSSSPDGPWSTVGITAHNYFTVGGSDAPTYFHVYPYDAESPVEQSLIDTLASGRSKSRYWGGINSAVSQDSWNSTSTVNHIEASGEYLYACMEGGSLGVLKNSSGTDLVPVDSFSDLSGGIPRHLTIAGDYGFLCCEGSGLVILDLSDPSSPERLGELNDFDGNFPVKSILYGSTLYLIISDGSGIPKTSLGVVDVSDPASPQLIKENSYFWNNLQDILIVRSRTLDKNLFLASYTKVSTPCLEAYSLSSPHIFNEDEISAESASIYSLSANFTRRMSYADGYLICTISSLPTGQGERLLRVDMQSPFPGYDSFATLSTDIFRQLDMDRYSDTEHNIIALGGVSVYNSPSGFLRCTGTTTFPSWESSFNVSMMTEEDTTCIEIRDDSAYLGTTEGIELFQLSGY